MNLAPGTPCFFINGARYEGAADYETLWAALEERLIKNML